MPLDIQILLAILGLLGLWAWLYRPEYQIKWRIELLNQSIAAITPKIAAVEALLASMGIPKRLLENADELHGSVSSSAAGLPHLRETARQLSGVSPADSAADQSEHVVHPADGAAPVGS